ncbi:MAG: trigger factor [Eubacteriales bacterium]|nr:trigger factor [Clostridiales bacterium]MDD7301940.1 trigger factor [Eubacteriales bacterium]MDY4436036.1 trigger factor [Candidatus Flemingibacterium sp.]
MSLKNVNKPETNVVEIEFTSDKAAFDAACDKAYKKNVGSISVPGFRKGKAPKHIIEKMYGKGVFYDEALNEIVNPAFADAIKDQDFKMVSQPEFDVVSIDDDGVTFKAKFYVKPEVEITDYIGIPVTKTVREASDEDADNEISDTQKRNSRQVEVTDRAAQDGDIVVIDFDGYVDDKPFEGGKAEKYNLTLGSGQFIPGFEEQIVGKNIGDEFDVNVTFPAEYHAAELAGKPAVFKIKLHEIKFNELPALDDEFAKDVSEFDTFAEYKADVKAKIQDRYNKQADGEVEEQLINALIEKLKAEIPEPMYVAETENFVRDFDGRLRMQGLDLKTYFKYTGLDLDALRKQMRPQAERQVKTRLALEKIVELEGIKPTDEEIAAEYDRIAKAYNMELDKVKEMVDEAAIAEDVAVKKAVDLVKEKAVVTEKAYEEPKTEETKAEDAEAPKAE